MHIAHECHVPRMVQRQNNMLDLRRSGNENKQILRDKFAHLRQRNQILRNQADPRYFMEVQKRLIHIELMQIFFLLDNQQADPAASMNCIMRGLKGGTLKQFDAEIFQGIGVRTDALDTTGWTQNKDGLIFLRRFGDF